MANSLKFVRAHNRDLSLWQSAVAEHVRRELSTTGTAAVSQADVLKHHLSVAAALHVEAAAVDPAYSPPPATAGHQLERHIYQSHLGMQLGKAIAMQSDTKELLTQYRHYSDGDYEGFASCAKIYAEYLIKCRGKKTYHDWTVEGKNNFEYGVINWKLPNNAKVAIIGDWGTGLPDAIALLRDIMSQHKPDAIIHLGDIYYSGTPEECQHNFAGIFTQIFDEVLGKGKRIPVFTIPGNHDYYAWGADYYAMVEKLNNYPGLTEAVQPASYFCLRTEDMGWQFVGMDTGYNDSDPQDQFLPNLGGPGLTETEARWMQYHMHRFSGATILLSHHQLFSANAKINGMVSEYGRLPYINLSLYRTFRDFLANRVAAWIWGHEHNFVLYQNNLFGLAKGRLVGNSAYEELTDANPYAVNYPSVPYLTSGPDYERYKLGINTDSNGVRYYNHGYAILDFGARKTPDAPVPITYYQFPAWGDIMPKNPQKSSQLYTENLALPPRPEFKALTSTLPVHLIGEEGLAIAGEEQTPYGNYPFLAMRGTGMTTMYIKLEGNSINPSTPLKDGDTVTIQNHNAELLSAGTAPSLFYSSGKYGNKNSLWTVKKHRVATDSGDPTIYVGDALGFINEAYQQWLFPYFAPLTSAIYLTTRDPNAPYFWTTIAYQASFKEIT